MIVLISIPGILGHLHPVIVHLPIGILLLACLFELISMRPRYEKLQPAVSPMLFMGAMGSVMSCISGYFLSLSGEYDGTLVASHQWAGIATAAVAFLYVFLRNKVAIPLRLSVAVIVCGLITFTGHLGGSLTHGSDYLAAGWTDVGGSTVKRAPIPVIEEAAVYADLVQPVLAEKCYNCHGAGKQKGKLRLDQPDFILKGGESGNTILWGKAAESEMISRMLLPVNDDDHMPPKEKPQLTAAEVELLKWWINSGDNFTQKVKELPSDEKMKHILLALQSGDNGYPTALAADKVIPEAPVDAADAVAVDKLKKAGVMIVPVERNSNYLSANFVTAANGADSIIALLSPLKKQLVWLKLDNAGITDESLSLIGDLPSLRKLQLSNTAITDKGLSKLQSLPELQSLNLVGTGVTAKGLQVLQKSKSLRSLYLYESQVKKEDYAGIKKMFPKVDVDSGNYVVPTFITDTTVVTGKK